MLRPFLVTRAHLGGGAVAQQLDQRGALRAGESARTLVEHLLKGAA